jgi:hypothetical protein
MSTQNSAQWFNPFSDVLEAGGNGIIASRLSTAQRTALTLTAADAGRMVFDVALGELFVWSGTQWASGTLPSGFADGEVLFSSGGSITGSTALTFNSGTGAFAVTGQVLSSTAAAITASAPAFQATQTWNNAGVTFKANVTSITDTTSAAGSLLHDYLVGGVSKVSFRKDGLVALGGFFQLAPNSDGVVTLLNNAGTAFGRLNWGGTTNAFPSIKRNGTFLECRLADDSARCGIRMDYIVTAANGVGMELTAASATGINMTPTADGVMLLTNYAGTSFSILNLGPATSSFVAIKRNSQTITARLGDDSAYSLLQGKLRTETAYAAGVVAPTGTITIYDSTGTAYRVSCAL